MSERFRVGSVHFVPSGESCNVGKSSPLQTALKLRKLRREKRRQKRKRVSGSVKKDLRREMVQRNLENLQEGMNGREPNLEKEVQPERRGMSHAKHLFPILCIERERGGDRDRRVM